MEENLEEWDIRVVRMIDGEEVAEKVNTTAKVVENEKINTEPRCTIVTCYYRSPSKHSLEAYDKWMANFLTTVDNEMVIFCDQESYEQIMTLRKPFEDKTEVFVFPLQDTYCGNPHYMPYWQKDIQRDIERSIHNTNLYIIWNEKCMFVQRAMSLNPFDTEFFMWCDIGCFRNPEELPLFQKEWPSTKFLRTARKNKMYFLNITPFEERDFTILPNGLTRSFEYDTRIGGTIFLGHKDIFETWVETFYKYMNVYMTQDYFTGKDQNIIASIYVLHPHLFRLVHPIDGEGNPWFYLQRFFLEKEWKEPESI